MVMYSLQTFAFFSKSYICNLVDLVEKLKNVNISENTISSSFDIVSMYTNINETESEKLSENKINENYDLIEVSASGLDCDVLMTLVKLCNEYSMYFQFRNSFYQQINGLPIGAPLSGLLANIYVEHIENWALNSFF